MVIIFTLERDDGTYADEREVTSEVHIVTRFLTVRNAVMHAAVPWARGRNFRVHCPHRHFTAYYDGSGNERRNIVEQLRA